MPSLVTTIGDEEVIVLFEYNRPEKAVLYDSNMEGYPGCHSYTEIISVLKRGVDITDSLTIEQIQELEVECLEKYEEDMRE